MKILNGIINYVKQIPNKVGQLLNQAALRILVIGNIAKLYAIQTGKNILQGIISYIQQLPGRAYTFLMQLPGRITNAAGAAVGAASSLASQVVQAVVNGVKGLADTVYNEFASIGSRINDAVSSAVSAAASFGSDIKDAVLNALNIASPGIIQRKIAIEFADIPGRIGESTDYVYSAARDYAGNIIRGFNAPQMSLASMGMIRENSNYTPTTTSNRNVTVVHVHRNAVSVDARGMTKQEAQGVLTLSLENLFNNPESVGGA